MKKILRNLGLIILLVLGILGPGSVCLGIGVYMFFRMSNPIFPLEPVVAYSIGMGAIMVGLIWMWRLGTTAIRSLPEEYGLGDSCPGWLKRAAQRLEKMAKDEPLY